MTSTQLNRCRVLRKNGPNIFVCIGNRIELRHLGTLQGESNPLGLRIGIASSPSIVRQCKWGFQHHPYRPDPIHLCNWPGGTNSSAAYWKRERRNERGRRIDEQDRLQPPRELLQLIGGVNVDRCAGERPEHEYRGLNSADDRGLRLTLGGSSLR